jgi:hypothetical protein
MKRIICKSCSRIIEIESSYIGTNALGEPVFVQRAHSTVTGSELQCACGKLL